MIYSEQELFLIIITLIVPIKMQLCVLIKLSVVILSVIVLSVAAPSVHIVGSIL